MAFGINKTFNFCLMTTANYLTKALVMYDSLQKQCKDDFNMFYFCFDENTYKALNKLNYKNIIAIPFQKFEENSPELLKIKKNRTIIEYFFTCTPQIIKYIIDNFNVKQVIYVDADLYFYKSPKIILDEMGTKDVFITEHWYYPKIKFMPQGLYCVQFIPFNNNIKGLQVLNDWTNKCLELCSLKGEGDKFADQGYLNDWPKKFKQVGVMTNRGGGLASWNIDGYDFKLKSNVLTVFSKEINKEIEAVFFHFHGVKIYANGLISTGVKKDQKNAYSFVYKEYISKISQKEVTILKQLNTKRHFIKYEHWSDSNFIFLLKEIRRIIWLKPNDIIYYLKFFNKFRIIP